MNLFHIRNWTKVVGNYYYGEFHDKDVFIFKDINGNEKDFKEMKFDVIIGNPPYQNGKDSKFYVNFIENSLRFLKENSHISFITPNRFCIPNTKIHNLLNSIQLHYIKNNCSNSFPYISTFIGYFIGEKTNIVDNTKVKIHFNDDYIKFIDYNNVYLPTQNIEINDNCLNILDKILQFKDCLVVSSEYKTNGVWCSRRWKRWNSLTEKGGFHVFNTFDDTLIDGKYFILSEKDNPEYFKNFISKSKLMRYLSYCFSGSMNVLPFLWNNIPKLDFSKNWTDEELFDYFKITQYEKDFINAFIK